MKYILSIFIILLGCLATFGQPSPKAEKFFQKAKEAIRSRDGDKAIAYFRKAMTESPDYYEAQAQLAILLNRLGREEEAITEMERLITIDPMREPYVYFQLGKAHFKRDHWEKAKSFLKQFSRFEDLDKEDLNTALDLIDICQFRHHALEHPVPFEPIALSASINSSGDEFNPTITADGQRMVFTRNDGRQEDFYLSVNTVGEWQPAIPLDELNTPENEGAHCLSKNGRTMIFTSCNNRQGLGSCDLYETRWENGRWLDPVNLGPTVNSRHWESQPTLSADGQLLIFSSKRPEGKGGADLWFTRRSSRGEWEEAKPLPGFVNTSGDEETPFLHADGETLYLSSTGHPGMGQTDLFLSRWSVDSGWSAPLNLGYPINTAEQEQAMTIGLDGKTAFFSSNRWTTSGRSDYDLYSFLLPSDRRGLPVTYVQGTVQSVKNRQRLPATIQFRPLGKSDRAAISVTASQDGYYLICLPAGERYAVLIDYPGYSFYSQSFDLNDTLAFHPYQLDVQLFPLESRQIEEDQHIVLNNILFASGSAELLFESTFELEKVRLFLNEHPKLRIRIEGHTDNVGKPEENRLLSEKRALSVVNWLITNGIAAERMQHVGFGESKPLVENTSREQRQMNRRTELVILP